MTQFIITPVDPSNEFIPGDKIRAVVSVRAKLMPENQGDIVRGDVYIVQLVDGNHLWIKGKACAFHHTYFRSTRATPGGDRAAVKKAIADIDKEMGGEPAKA